MSVYVVKLYVVVFTSRSPMASFIDLKLKITSINVVQGQGIMVTGSEDKIIRVSSQHAMITNCYCYPNISIIGMEYCTDNELVYVLLYDILLCQVSLVVVHFAICDIYDHYYYFCTFYLFYCVKYERNIFASIY